MPSIYVMGGEMSEIQQKARLESGGHKVQKYVVSIQEIREYFGFCIF